MAAVQGAERCEWLIQSLLAMLFIFTIRLTFSPFNLDQSLQTPHESERGGLKRFHEWSQMCGSHTPDNPSDLRGFFILIRRSRKRFRQDEHF